MSSGKEEKVDVRRAHLDDIPQMGLDVVWKVSLYEKLDACTSGIGEDALRWDGLG